MGDPLDDLRAPVGQVRSGYLRYAAAMHFYQRGELSAELLEIYRWCCKWDGEDPVAVAEHEGVCTQVPALK